VTHDRTSTLLLSINHIDKYVYTCTRTPPVMRSPTGSDWEVVAYSGGITRARTEITRARTGL